MSRVACLRSHPKRALLPRLARAPKERRGSGGMDDLESRESRDVRDGAPERAFADFLAALAACRSESLRLTAAHTAVFEAHDHARDALAWGRSAGPQVGSAFGAWNALDEAVDSFRDLFETLKAAFLRLVKSVDPATGRALVDSAEAAFELFRMQLDAALYWRISKSHLIQLATMLCQGDPTGSATLDFAASGLGATPSRIAGRLQFPRNGDLDGRDALLRGMWSVSSKERSDIFSGMDQPEAREYVEKAAVRKAIDDYRALVGRRAAEEQGEPAEGDEATEPAEPPLTFLSISDEANASELGLIADAAQDEASMNALVAEVAALADLRGRELAVLQARTQGATWAEATAGDRSLERKIRRRVEPWRDSLRRRASLG